MTKRNPTIATILSLFLGPLGYLYIGINFLMAGLIISVLFTIVLYLINLPFPYFFDYLQLLVYAYYGYKLALIRNLFAYNWGISDIDIKEFKSFGFGFVVMTNLLMTLTQFYSLIVGLWLVYRSFSNGKILMGILILIFGIALISWLLTSIFGFITGMLMLIFKIDKKYFANE
jgi:hypothetical protein